MSRLSRACALLIVALAALTLTSSATATRTSTSQIPLAAVLASPCTADIVTFTGTAVITVAEDTASNGAVKVGAPGMGNEPVATGLLAPGTCKGQSSTSD